MLSRFQEKIKQNPRLKQNVLNLLVHPVKTRPRFWLRIFQFLYLKRGKKSVIYKNVRKDLVPFNTFSLGKRSVIESFSTLNNMVGPIRIGDNSRIGIGNTVIGPVTVGNHVNLAQNIVLSGLNHNYRDTQREIDAQGVTTAPVFIDDDVWIGANTVVLAGVTVGKHTVIAAGSVVTRDIPPYCVAAGNPARPVKQYDFKQQEWVKASCSRQQ